jgi:DNA-binding response OmpR family regulator
MAADMKAGAHLLLVEDEPVAAKMLSRILSLEGFRVSTAPDGVAALEQLADESPDALITDLKMPRGGGGDLVREARALHADLPIIVITADTSRATSSANSKSSALPPFSSSRWRSAT